MKEATAEKIPEVPGPPPTFVKRTVPPPEIVLLPFPQIISGPEYHRIWFTLIANVSLLATLSCPVTFTPLLVRVMVSVDEGSMVRL